MHRTIRQAVFIVALVLLALIGKPMAAQSQEGAALAFYQGGGFRDASWGRVTLRLDLSQAVPWRVFTLDNPYRLVVDFREVNWQNADLAKMDAARGVTALRVGPFSTGWSRLVAELADPMAIEKAGLKVDRDSRSATLDLTLIPTSIEEFAQRSGAPLGPGWVQPLGPVQDRTERDPDRKVKVVLDPGHGGIDPGAENGATREADLMLLFARELRDVLLRSGGFDVALTRSDDSFVSLEARVRAAHDAGGDVFVSLHADALQEGVARGASVYTLSEDASDAASAALAERHDRDDILAGVDLAGSDDQVASILIEMARLDNTPRSQALARHVVGGIENAVGLVHKRPIRQAGFSVLKAADIPSILIELGFLSTERDLQNLQDPIWRAGMAAGIRDGLQNWVAEDKALAGLRRQ